MTSANNKKSKVLIFLITDKLRRKEIVIAIDILKITFSIIREKQIIKNIDNKVMINKLIFLTFKVISLFINKIKNKRLGKIKKI